MATGGAWQSEKFDNGRDFEKPALFETQLASGGTPPAMYNAPASSTHAADRGAFGALALALRVAQIVLTLIAFSIMAANKQTLYGYYYDVSFKFSSVKAFVGVLAMNCIVCFYAIVQLVHSFVNMGSKGSFVSSATTGFALLTFIFDLVLAFALVAAAAAGADSAAILADDGGDQVRSEGAGVRGDDLLGFRRVGCVRALVPDPSSEAGQFVIVIVVVFVSGN